MSEYQNEYFRMAAFLNMMGFQQSKNDLTEFCKPFELDVKAQIMDQDEDEKFHLEGTIIFIFMVNIFGILIGILQRLKLEDCFKPLLISKVISLLMLFWRV